MNASETVVERTAVAAVYPHIARYVRRTPVVEACGEDFGLPGLRLAFKLESLQAPGSFKARGAFANLLTRDIPAAGVAAASGGNHGAAVAYAAMRLGAKAKIFVPQVSSPAKVARIRAYGAELAITGDRYSDTIEACRDYVAASGAIDVHAFDRYETLLGTATVGLEVEEQMQADTVLVAVGGGGLIAGIASWFAGRGVRVVGVEPEGAPTLTYALAAGRPVNAPTESVANDSLAPASVGEIVFPIAQRHVDRVVLVSDDAIRLAQKALWHGLTTVAEPGGAAAFAALISKQYVPEPGERVCVVVSGGNTATLP
ncbi:MAG: threonine/serine dehydratase [Candidatus Eremiobacteraeota bacterium]|nr:threonine/serine dehydratase [Candidatus Eremiobacteraeota bacterium]